MKLNKQLEREVRQVYMAYWECYLKGDAQTLAAMFAESITVFGSSEVEVFRNKQEVAGFFTATANEFVDKVDFRNRDIRIEPLDGYVLINEQFDLYVLVDAEWAFYSKGRISSLLQKQESGWKFVHQHGSVPDNRTQEGETIAFERITRENLELREAVKRRTVELEHKNRALEIEAALERVRGRAMAMRSSDELAELSYELVKEVQALGVATWHCAFNIYDEDQKSSTEWGSNADGFYPIYKTPREGIFLRYYEIGQTGETLHIEEIGEDKCADHYAYLCTLPGVGEQLLNLRDSGVSFPTSQIDHVAYFKYGYLIFITFEPAPEAHDIFIRFAKVFEQTYIRFLDLKKSEEQLREAQIEAALEKIRSRSLAMHTTNELSDVVTVIVEKLIDLGVVLDAGGVVLCTYFQDSKDVMQWIASPDFSYSGSYLLPYFDHPIFNESWDFKNSSIDYSSKAYSYEEKKSFFEYAFEHSDFKNFPDEFKTWVFENNKYTLSFAWAKNSAILIPSHTGTLPSESDKKILIRFARVFEQAYIRFLDLQQAEEQTREAQIEAALERVRSRTMAMHSSDELSDVVTRVFGELTRLDFELTRCVIWVFDPDTQSGRIWMANPEQPDAPESYFIPYHDHPSYHALFDAWRERDPAWVYDLHGDLKTTWDEVLFNETELGRLPAEVQAGMRAPDRVVLTLSFTSFGALQAAGLEALSEQNTAILRRFARVFDQTYTRFLDLKQAEARSREAQIEAAMERVRSRALAMTSSEELLDVIFKIHQEFLGLGLPCGLFWQTRYTPECYQKALTGIGGKKISAIMELPRDFSSVPELAAWERSDEKVGVFKFDADAACSYLHHMVTKGHFLEVDPEGITEEMVRENDGFTFVQARTSHGEIGYSLWGETEPSEEAKDVLVRFTSAFDLAYRRFEDLQQAEADHQALLEEKTLTEQALKELRATQAQLVQSEKLASLGQLTAGIAHEIKNPLNFVNNFAEVNEELADELEEAVDAGGAPDTLKEIIGDLRTNARVINQHGKRADAIVHAMMQHASGGRGQREPTDINQLVSEHIDLAYHGKRAQVPGLEVEIERGLGDNAGDVVLVPQEIGRVLLNLLGNALDAVHEHEGTVYDEYIPTITVSTRHLDGQVEIRVSDNGPGIPAAIREKIFEPFFTTKPTGSGTGLGLSLSYDIVTQGHGGTLTVESEEGKGATFIVTLPVNHAAPDHS